MILCAGEALIDMVPRETADGAAYLPLAGGAIFNTAIGLGRLGVGVGFFSGLSRDLFGETLEAALKDAGVATDLALRSNRPTTLAFVQLKEGHATYTFYDENTAGRMIEPADLPVLPDEVAALYVGGISLISEPAAGAYEALALKAASDRVLMIDPNIRQGFVTDEATYRARIDRLLAASDIIKVSDEDLDWLRPGPGDYREKMAGLMTDGASLVIVTRGGDGATGLLGDGTSVEVPARTVAVVDTVGAGDTFNAGVLASLAEAGCLTKAGLAALGGDVARDALAFGAKVAAVTVSRAGADAPWAHEL